MGMGSIIDGHGLLAPLDAARFALAYLALAVVPGYALAALTRPRSDWIERLALSIPCAYALVAVGGLATALLHLPFDLPAYAALALPVTVAGAAALWRQRGRRADAGVGRWWLAPAAVAVAQLGTTALVYAANTVPGGIDAVMHVIWTGLIARSHVFPIALMSAHPGGTDGAFYPPAFHALTALVLGAAPMATYRAVFFSVVAATLPLPLALFAYVRTATGSARLAGLASLAALAFEPLPFFILAQSLYPFAAALLIVPALVIALYHGCGYGDRRALLLAALLGVGLFYTHPTEFVTVAVLALAVVPGLLRTVRSWVRAAGYGLAVLAVWALAAAPALAAVHRTMVFGAQREIRSSHDFTAPPHVDLLAALGGYVQWVYGRNVSYLLLAAVVAGAAWCLMRRRWVGLVVAQAAVALVFVDTNTFNVLQRLYALSFPWAMGDRLPPVHYWLALPLAAIGVDAVARRVHARLPAVHGAFTALLASPLVLLGLALPLTVTVQHVALYAGARRLVAPADLDALTWLSRHGQPGSVVVTDADTSRAAPFDVPIDAGLWLPVWGGPQPLFGRGGAGPGALDDRFYLLQHVGDGDLPPRAARYVSRYHVRYVFYAAGPLPGVARHLSLARLLVDRRLRLVYSSAPACRPGAGHAGAACPATGSYVFALRDGAPMVASREG